ncbi:MAG: hypothetical protein J0G28_14950 [Afipia sp.]|nr:hypothetical protein [Afipia sp.]OJW65738.1 MAG: hypothetical protein BGO65_12780 [Afipia sp. 64-13]
MPTASVSSLTGVMFRHTLRLGAAAFGVALILSTGYARAQDDEDAQPEETFEQGIIKGIMKGIGGQSIEDGRIEYRERSPLVVPSTLDLPPPQAKGVAPAANWPKDPDEQARREAIAASRKAGPRDAYEAQTEAQRVLRPSELAGQPQGKRKRSADNDVTPGSYVGGYNSYMLSPSELGTSVGGLFSSITGKQKQEAVTFKEEPKRESLTQPPSGYQTPSSNYAYGTGPEKSETRTPYNPITDKGDPTLR